MKKMRIWLASKILGRHGLIFDFDRDNIRQVQPGTVKVGYPHSSTSTWTNSDQ